MTLKDFEYFEDYKQRLQKFIFAEARNLNVQEYVNLNDEIRSIDNYLKANEKFLPIGV